MNKYIKYLIFSVILLIFNSCLDDPIKTQIPEKSIFSAKIIGSKVWIVGDEGITAYSQDGINFSKQNGSNGTYLDICGIGNNLWRCGSNGRIEYSSNLGVNWQLQNSGTNKFVKSIYFIDANNGIAVGQYGLVISTTDGGNNWQNRIFPNNYNLNKVKFLNDKFGVIVSRNIAGLNTPVYITKDAGLTFDTTYIADNDYLTDIAFISENEFYVSGTKSIYKTTNGGSTFDNIVDLALVNNDETNNPTVIESMFLEGNDIYFAGYFGHNLGRIYKINLTSNIITLLYGGQEAISCSNIIIQNQNIISYGGYGYKILYKNIADTAQIWSIKSIE